MQSQDIHQRVPQVVRPVVAGVMIRGYGYRRTLDVIAVVAQAEAEFSVRHVCIVHLKIAEDLLSRADVDNNVRIAVIE